MDVLILSAGKGERLYPLTKNTPKALLDLGNGETLIESQLHAIDDCPGIGRVFVVGGYRCEQIEAKLAHWEGLPVEVIYNPFFETTNNLVSMWLGLLAVPSREVITINGDNLFRPELLRLLLNAPEEDAISMVVDRPEREMNDDDMKVVIAGGRVLEVPKDIPLERANGESIGIIRFRETGLEMFRHTLDRMVRNRASHGLFYLAAMHEIMSQGFPVHFVECEESWWAEVDFHHDLRDVRQLVNDDFLATLSQA